MQREDEKEHLRDTVGIPVDMSWCTGVYLHRRIGTQVYIKTHYKIKQKNFLSTPSHVVPVHAQLILIYLLCIPVAVADTDTCNPLILFFPFLPNAVQRLPQN